MMRAFLRLRADAGMRRLTGAQWTAACRNGITTTADIPPLPPWPPGDAAAAADEPAAAAALLRAASLPPACYTSPAAADLDLARVFHPAWLYAGPAAWVDKPGDYFTIGGGGGEGGGGGGGGGAVPRAVVVRAPSDDGGLRAFHNVCRHRAAPVATCARGNRLREQQQEQGKEGSTAAANPAARCTFVCGYHGWRYSAEGGRLVLAPKMGGVERLNARCLSLTPLDVATVGPLVFVRRRRRQQQDEGEGYAGSAAGLDAWLGPEGAAAVLAVVRDDYAGCDLAAAEQEGESEPPEPPPMPPLLHVARREWRLRCDWKVFADNFLDGGYHVSCAHPGLAEGLDLKSYSSRMHGPRVSVQSVAAAAAAAKDDTTSSSSGRLGRRAAYAWVFPNLALNRYGPWLDVNAVVPDGPGRCRVTFDWFLDKGAPGAEAAAAAADALSLSCSGSSSAPPPPWDEQLRLLPPAVSEALRSSCRVQEEDVALCEGVQLGLEEEAGAALRGGGGAGAVYGSPSVEGRDGGGTGGGVVCGGRYARQEAPMFHFHRALWAEYRNDRHRREERGSVV